MTPLDGTPRDLAAWDTMHILVAHDNPRFLAPLATALRSVGHEVTACDNAMSAWDALNSASIDLLITQTQFPYPQPDGVALALKARGIEQGLRVPGNRHQELP